MQFLLLPNEIGGVLADPTRLSLTRRTHGFLVPPCARRLLVIISLAIIQAPSFHFAGFSLLNSCFVAGLAGALASILWCRSALWLAAMDSSPSHVYAMATIWALTSSFVANTRDIPNASAPIPDSRFLSSPLLCQPVLRHAALRSSSWNTRRPALSR